MCRRFETSVFGVRRLQKRRTHTHTHTYTHTYTPPALVAEDSHDRGGALTQQQQQHSVGVPAAVSQVLGLAAGAGGCVQRAVHHSDSGLQTVSLQLLLWLFGVGAVGAGQFATLVVVV